MPQTCSICSHQKRSAIEMALTAGKSLRDVARQYATSKDALARHKENCIKTAVQEVIEARKIDTTITVLGDLDWLRAQALKLFTDLAKFSADPKPLVSLLAEMRQQTKLRAELTGELDQRAQVNIVQSPDWQQMRAAFLEALAEMPEARQKFIRLMEATGA